MFATNLNVRFMVAVEVALKHGYAEIVDGYVIEMRRNEFWDLVSRLCVATTDYNCDRPHQ